MHKFFLILIFLTYNIYASQISDEELKKQKIEKIDKFIKLHNEPFKQEINKNISEYVPKSQRIEDGILSYIVDYAQSCPKIILENKNINDVSWSPDGTMLAISSDNHGYGTLEIYKTQNWQIIKKETLIRYDFSCCKWSPDGHSLAASAGREGICLLDMNNLERKAQFLKDNQYVNSIFWLNNNIVVSGGAGSRLTTWDIITNQCIFQKNLDFDVIDYLQLSPCQTKVIVDFDSTIRIYDLHNFKLLTCSHVFYNAVNWSPDGEWILSNTDNITNIYETDNWNLIHTFENISKVNQIAFSEDGKNLAIGLDNGLVNIYNFPDLKLIKTLYCKNCSDSVNSMSWSPDNITLAVGYNSGCAIWEIID